MATKQENKKKKTTHRSSTTTSTTNIVNVLAFCALSAAALLLLIGPILRWILVKTGGGIILQVLNVVAMYCLLGAIAIPAWHFVRGKRKGWRIFYFVMLAVYVLATIFGVTFGIL